MAKRTRRTHSAVFNVNVALARMVQGLSCRGIARIRDVIASVSLENVVEVY
ncbi:MAG: hypothetical protein ABIO96_14175 [Nitrospiraceae bacterium]